MFFFNILGFSSGITGHLDLNINSYTIQNISLRTVVLWNPKVLLKNMFTVIIIVYIFYDIKARSRWTEHIARSNP